MNNEDYISMLYITADIVSGKPLKRRCLSDYIKMLERVEADLISVNISEE